jgi:hypothetical protein
MMRALDLRSASADRHGRHAAQFLDRVGHQQHGDGPHHDSDRYSGCNRGWGVRATRINEHCRSLGGCVPYACCNPCKLDGDGSRWLPFWGLLEARAAIAAAFLRGGDLSRSDVLAILSAVGEATMLRFITARRVEAVRSRQIAAILHKNIASS